MADRKHLLHVKSNVAEITKQYGIDDFLVTPKKPVNPTTGKATDDTLLYGEIAVNYGKDTEALMIRNTNNDVVTFVNENDFHEAGEITADGMAYLNNKIDTSAVSKMVPVTYADIKVLRDQSKLKAGQLYRITDYVTTTTHAKTQSAGHAFDIIVLATDVDTLNENAKVVKHEGDTYFANSNLDAWEIKYDLDNDTTKYAWADATNGKGVIYYMKDEFNNECPYDFKNVLFKRYKLKNKSGLHIADYPLETSYYDDSVNQAFINWQNYLGASMDSTNVSFYYTRGVYSEYLVSGADIYGYDNSYYYYDGRNLVFDENSGGSYVSLFKAYDYFDIIAEVEDTNGEWFYTFSKKATATDAAVDASLSKLTSVGCYNNSIKEYIAGKRYFLNNNIFIVLGNSGSIDSNTFGNNCLYNSFGNYCNSNSFGNSCGYNTFGYSCGHKSFGNGCGYNSFGNSCGYNTFGNNCLYNSFGSTCDSNSFGNDCDSNSFGYFVIYNSFGNDCNYNSFEDSCNSNSFGNNCGYNSFGYGCSSNSFGNGCDYNSFGNSCDYNSFGNDCDYIIFSKDYMNCNIVENSNAYITVTSTQTTSSSLVLRNFTIAQGVNNTTTRKTISHNTTNDTFKTTYQNANSKAVNV